MSYTILILEDEATICENLATYLEDEGYTILQAQNAEFALNLLNSHTPDLAVVDIRLPDMDGNEWMLEAARKQPSLKYIVYTGLMDYQPGEALRHLSLSSDDIIYKPLMDMSLLTELIDKKLSG